MTWTPASPWGAAGAVDPAADPEQPGGPNVPLPTIRKVEGDHVVTPHRVVQRGLRTDVGLVVGAGADVRGGIEALGYVHLARAAVVRGSVRGGLDVVVGARAVVAGDVVAGGNLHLLDGARVLGEARARGDLVCRPRVCAALLHADGDVRVTPPVEVGSVESGGRTAFVRGETPTPSERPA